MVLWSPLLSFKSQSSSSIAGAQAVASSVDAVSTPVGTICSCYIFLFILWRSVKFRLLCVTLWVKILAFGERGIFHNFIRVPLAWIVEVCPVELNTCEVEATTLFYLESLGNTLLWLMLLNTFLGAEQCAMIFITEYHDHYHIQFIFYIIRSHLCSHWRYQHRPYYIIQRQHSLTS